MMDLKEAIDAVKWVTRDNDPWTGNDISGDDQNASAIDTAIATILNAVVKGELRE